MHTALAARSCLTARRTTKTKNSVFMNGVASASMEGDKEAYRRGVGH